jgi:hypothetical protein
MTFILLHLVKHSHLLVDASISWFWLGYKEDIKVWLHIHTLLSLLLHCLHIHTSFGMHMDMIGIILDWILLMGNRICCWESLFWMGCGGILIVLFCYDLLGYALSLYLLMIWMVGIRLYLVMGRLFNVLMKYLRELLLQGK